MQRRNGMRTWTGAALAAACVGLSACAQRVWMMVPAKVDLAGYERLGIVEMRGTDVELCRRATRELQQKLLEARPGILLVELDAPASDDPQALHALAREQGLSAVFVGELDFSDVTPSFGIGVSLVEVQARAELRGSLSVRLVEADSGAMAWARSVDRTVTVASADLDSIGTGSLGVSDVQATKVAMIGGMVQEATHAFRDQYFRRKLEDVPPTYHATYPDGVEVYVPAEAVER